MDVDVLFVGVAVTDFGRAQDWYERFFGRPPDVVPHETEAMWRVAGAGWLYILRDLEHAGSSIVAMAVPSLDAAAAALAERGVAAGPIEPEGDAGRKSVVRDPDGNTLAIIEVAGRGG